MLKNPLTEDKLIENILDYRPGQNDRLYNDIIFVHLQKIYHFARKIMVYLLIQ